MKGIVLAGDTDNKLSPLTEGVPKQLIPVYNVPMVYYPIYTLIAFGIREILIITTDRHRAAFKEALGDGTKFNVHLTYAIQHKREGIAQAITIAKGFIGKDDVCLITGDTIILGEALPILFTKAQKALKVSGSASIFVSDDNEPNQYGKVSKKNNGKPLDILGYEEILDCYSIAGLFVFPNNVKNMIDKIERSERGFYEITDLNKLYFDVGKLQTLRFSPSCLWFDTNTFDNLLRLNNYLQRT